MRRRQIEQQGMSRREFLDSLQNAELAGDEAHRQVAIERHVVQGARQCWSRQEALEFGCKSQRAAGQRIEQRFFPCPIARQKQMSPALVVQAKCKHAVKA